MRKSFRWILVLILLSGLTTLACGLFSNDEKPTTEPTTQATEGGGSTSAEPAQETIVEATLEPGGNEGESSGLSSQPLEEMDLSTLDLSLNFESYQLAMNMIFSGTDLTGKLISQTLSSEVSYVADPPARSIVMTGEGVEGTESFGGINMTQIEDTSYTVFPGMGCISTQTPGTDIFDDNPFDDFLNPSSFLDEINKSVRVGEETVNGVATVHYTFDESAMTNQGDFDWAEGHVYIAKEGNYLVKMSLDGEGAIGILDPSSKQNGTIHLDLNITNINQPFEIKVPEGCEEGGASGAGFPMLPDAFENTSLPGLLSYRSNATIEEAIDFYQEALKAEGWVFLEDESLASMGMLTFERESESVNIIITDESSGEGIAVSIISDNSGN